MSDTASSSPADSSGSANSCPPIFVVPTVEQTTITRHIHRNHAPFIRPSGEVGQIPVIKAEDKDDALHEAGICTSKSWSEHSKEKQLAAAKGAAQRTNNMYPTLTVKLEEDALFLKHMIQMLKKRHTNNRAPEKTEEQKHRDAVSKMMHQMQMKKNDEYLGEKLKELSPQALQTLYGLPEFERLERFQDILKNAPKVQRNAAEAELEKAQSIDRLHKLRENAEHARACLKKKRELAAQHAASGSVPIFNPKRARVLPSKKAQKLYASTLDRAMLASELQTTMSGFQPSASASGSSGSSPAGPEQAAADAAVFETATQVAAAMMET